MINFVAKTSENIYLLTYAENLVVKNCMKLLSDNCIIYYSKMQKKTYFLSFYGFTDINPLNAGLNPICHLLTLLGAHHILHVSRIRV